MNIYVFCVILLLCFTLSACGQNKETRLLDRSSSSNGIAVKTDSNVSQGAERMDAYLPLLQDKRVGLVVNHTSLVGMRHLVDTLLARDIDIQRILAPEHGYRGTADAGEIILDEKLKDIPVSSLYGSSKKPSSAQLQNLDMILFDIQDVGARFYTYISTMHYVLEACAEEKVDVIILDRPNPHGYYVDGPVLDTVYQSFVGMHEIPLVHGLTVGELAMMIKGEGWISNADQLQLEVVACEGWDRQSTFVLPVPPSPNLPNQQAVMLYPSLCLLEATVFSIGRGTEYPFQVYGRPEGTFGDFYFTPKSTKGSKHPKHKDVLCRGVDLRSYDLEDIYNMEALQLDLLLKCLSLNESIIDRPSFFNKLAGNDRLRKQLVEGKSVEEIRKSWREDLDNFRILRDKYRLYD